MNFIPQENIDRLEDAKKMLSSMLELINDLKKIGIEIEIKSINPKQLMDSISI